MKLLIALVLYAFALLLWLTAFIAGLDFGLSRRARVRVMIVLFAPVRVLNWIQQRREA